MFYVIGFDFNFDKDYFNVLKEIYINFNEKLINNDMKDLKYKLVFEKNKIIIKLFEKYLKYKLKQYKTFYNTYI